MIQFSFLQPQSLDSTINTASVHDGIPPTELFCSPGGEVRVVPKSIQVDRWINLGTISLHLVPAVLGEI